MSPTPIPNPADGPYETKEELYLMLKEVERWEQEQKDLWFWEKLGRLPFQLLDRLTPQALHKKLAQAMDEMGSYIHTGGQYLVSESALLNRLEEELRSGKESLILDQPLILELVGKLPLRVLSGAADKLSKTRVTLATAQGATTGIGGLFTLAIDIPAILGLSLKTIQEIAILYGYDPKEERERLFVIKCLQFASSDIVGKKAILSELASFESGDRSYETLSQLQGWREVIATYRDNFGWKKLFQMVPIAGMLFGAFLNRSALQDVSEAAAMLYRKRRILERLNVQG